MQTITVRNFFEDNKEIFNLRLLAGERGLDNPITVPEVQRPSLALAGFLKKFAYKRIQVLGYCEIEYAKSIRPDIFQENITALLETGIPCLVVTKNLSPPEVLVSLCDRLGVPLLVADFPTVRFISCATDYLVSLFAPTIEVHGSMMDVYGVGILLRGKAGIGKSECALALVKKGHRLIADDTVRITRREPNTLIATPSKLGGNFMEIRGVGVIDIEKLFGIRAITPKKEIELVVTLTPWNEIGEKLERIGEKYRHTELLGVSVPEIILPLSPGKSVSTLTEVIATNHMLKTRGENSAREFVKRVRQSLETEDEQEQN